MKLSLFQCLSGLRFFGIGTRVTRTIYRSPERFWIITRVDHSTKKVYGKLVWNGQLEDKEQHIRSSYKKEWKLVGFPDYDHFIPSNL